MDNNGLTGSQLSQLLRQGITQPFFRGVYAKNELNQIAPSLIDFNSKLDLFLCNSDTRQDRGRHWFLVGRGPGDFGIFFDSFGNDCPGFIKTFLVEHCNSKYWSECTYSLQNSNSKLCGAFCVLVACELCRGLSFRDIIDQFSAYDLTDNDQFVIEWFIIEYNIDLSSLK